MISASHNDTHLAILNSSKSFDEVGHIYEEASQLLHMIGIVAEDLLDGVNASLKSSDDE